jgi:hypothetical protein
MGPNGNSLNFANPQSLALGNDPTIGMATQSMTLENDTGIDMGALINEWKIATEYVRLYTRDFKFLDDLVDGVPLTHQNEAPFVGDTTLAGLVRSIPRDSLQQLPVLNVTINGTKVSINALLCTYLLKHYMFNENTLGKGLLSTMQIGGEAALSHGYQPFMVATGSMFNNYGTTLKMLHYMDTAPEPGIQDHNETGFDYVTAHLAPSRVRKILKAAKANKKTSWNVPALEQVLSQTPTTTDYSIYEGAARRNQPGEEAGPTYEFVTRIETGPEPTKITFCPQVSEVPLRVVESNSKWGYPQVMYLVIDPSALTPFGVSRVRLASPNQNLMNIYYGNIAAMLLLNSKPPILQKGRFSTPVVAKQGAVWKAIDANASADYKNMDNGALEQFVPFAQQFAAQIQNIMGRAMGAPNGGASGEAPQMPSPNPQQPGDTSTNQITKIFENFLRQYALVGLDVTLSEEAAMAETDDDGNEIPDVIIVDDDTKNQINDIKPGTIGEDNKFGVRWATLYESIEEWSVEVEVSVSQDQIDAKKRGDIQDMMVVLAQNAQDIPGAPELVTKLANMLLQDQVPLAGSIGPGPTTPSTGAVAPGAAGPLPGGNTPPAMSGTPMPANPAVGSPNQ